MPDGDVVLLLAPRASARASALERARQIEASGGGLHCLHCEVDCENASVAVASLRGGAPQSLTFALADERARTRLQTYLMSLRPKAIEVLAPHILPDAVLRVVFALHVPIRVVVGDLDWICDRRFVFERACAEAERPGECRTCVSRTPPEAPLGEGWSAGDRSRMRLLLARAESVVPMDRMAAACLAANRPAAALHPPPHEAATARAARRETRGTVLGVLSPEAHPETDRQISTIAEFLDLRGVEGSIVVLGQCLNEHGTTFTRSIFVTGPIDDDEYERALRQYRITHLFSPYRTRHFGLIDRLSAISGLAKGYFDWSFGGLEVDPGDLALDPRICFERAARDIGLWMTGRDR